MHSEHDNDPIYAQLTATEAPFALDQVDINGRATTVFRHAYRNLPALLNAGRVHGDKTFLIYQDDHWSFTRFFAEADALAAWIRDQGVAPGNRIAIAMRNRPEWAVTFVAAILAGAVPAPINSFGSREELRSAIAEVSPALICCDSDRLRRMQGDPGVVDCPVLRVGPEHEGAAAVPIHAYEQAVQTQPSTQPAPEPEPEDSALILFTSGASSRPKGVLSSHRAVCQALAHIEFVGAYSAMSSPDLIAKLMAAGHEPATLTVVPLFHVSGLHAQLLSALKNGRKLVFMYRWNSHDALDIMRTHQITQFNGAPAMVQQLISEEGFSSPDIKNRLAAIGFGGAGIPSGLIEQAFDELPDRMLGTGFGMTESNGVGSAISGDLFQAHPASSGLISPLMDVRISDAEGKPLPPGETGEIWLRGAPVMTGYWNNPEATAAAFEDGWLRTGDLGYIDSSDFLYVVDRLKDIINRSGENISAAEVESCLMRHPAVSEVAVFAIPDEQTGEAVAAVVRLATSHRPGVAELQQHVAARLAHYKVPREIEIRDQALQRNPAGKLIKPQIKREFLDLYQPC